MALNVYVTALSQPSVHWLDGWCGAGDNLVAGLLYQTECRSELKLSGSTKSDIVRLVASGAVSKPGGDAAGQDALHSASVE